MRELDNIRKSMVVMIGFNPNGRPLHQKITDNNDIDLKILSDKKFRGCNIVGVYEVGKLVELYPACHDEGV